MQPGDHRDDREGGALGLKTIHNWKEWMLKFFFFLIFLK